MDRDDGNGPLVVYGVNQSFFTRKMTGYLDYKQIPWILRRGLGMSTEVRAAGWDGGLPALITQRGDIGWDSTSLILHLDHHRPDRSVRSLVRWATNCCWPASGSCRRV